MLDITSWLISPMSMVPKSIWGLVPDDVGPPDVPSGPTPRAPLEPPDPPAAPDVPSLLASDSLPDWSSVFGVVGGVGGL